MGTSLNSHRARFLSPLAVLVRQAWFSVLGTPQGQNNCMNHLCGFPLKEQKPSSKDLGSEEAGCTRTLRTEKQGGGFCVMRPSDDVCVCFLVPLCLCGVSSGLRQDTLWSVPSSRMESRPLASRCLSRDSVFP